MELLRIAAMLMVLLLHCNYSVLGPITRIDIQSDALGSFMRVFLEQLCLCSVNVFVLISGWFGIRYKFHGLLSLQFQIVALAVLVTVFLLPFGIGVQYKCLFKVFYLGAYYWFVPSYLLLYIFSPVLNSFIENTEREGVKRLLICFFLLEFALGWLCDWEHFGLGYSGLSFMGLYLLARYINKYKGSLFITAWKQGWYVVSFLLCSLIPATISFLTLRVANYGFNQLSYASPFVIAASVSLLLLFTKFEFHSRFVNWIAASSFSMYLIQLHPMVWPVWTSSMRTLHGQTGGGNYTVSCLLISVIFGMVCIIIDQLRILFWNLLTKRKRI